MFRRTGLVSGRNDSGTHQRKGRGKRVVKTGDGYLRRAVLNALRSLIRHQPVRRQYDRRLRQSKPTGVALVATARRGLGIWWATLRDQRPATLILQRGAIM